MQDSRAQSKSLPIDKIVLFLSLAFVVSCVIVAFNRRGLRYEGDAAALPAGHAVPGSSTGVATPQDESGDSGGETLARAGWPPVERERLRYGIVHDVADAFALGKHSGLVSLSTETEQMLFDDWCARAAAWQDRWNRDPVLYADGKDRSGTHVYRLELHGQELGRIHTVRYANGWNIVGVERKLTEADALAEERILREAAARAGVVRDGPVRESTVSPTRSEERESLEE